MINRSISIYISILQVIAYYLGIAIVLTVLATNTLHLLIPTDSFIDSRVFDSDRKLLFFISSVCLIFFTWITELIKGNIIFISPSSLRKNIKLSYFITAIFLASVYRNIYSSSLILMYLTFAITVYLFYMLTPQFVRLFMKYRVRRAGGIIFNSKEMNLSQNFYSKFFLIIFGTLVVISSGLLVIKVAYNNLPNVIAKNIAIRNGFTLASIEPNSLTHAQTVKLKGFNLGWGTQSDPRFRVLSSSGPIPQIIEWTENTITFIAPLHLREGTQYIWAQRPKDPSNKKSTIIKTNAISAQVYSRFDYYPDLGEDKKQRAFKKIKRSLFLNMQKLLDFYSEL